MKISFTTMATPELDIPSQVAAAKAYGFDGVDLRVVERGKGEIPRDLSQPEAETILGMIHGIEVPSLLSYNEKIKSGQHAMEASLLSHMALAAQLHIPTIRIFTGKLENDEDLNELVRVLRSVLQKDTSGTNLAMQNHVNSSVNLHQALEICKQVGNPRVSIILSPDQAVIIEEEYETLLPQLAKYMSQLYVADLDGTKKHVLLGQGKIPYQRILHVLRENGFDGYVTLKWEKCWHPELPSYQKAFQAFLTWYSKCLPGN